MVETFQERGTCWRVEVDMAYANRGELLLSPGKLCYQKTLRVVET